MDRPNKPIDAPEQASAAEQCAFCILIKEGSGKLVQEWDDAIAISPLNPATAGHLLVLPIAHIENALELSPPLSCSIWEHALEMGRLIDKSLKPAGLNLITSAGEAATQTIFHLHLHILPRYRQDTVGDFWPNTGVGEKAQEKALRIIRSTA